MWPDSLLAVGGQAHAFSLDGQLEYGTKDYRIWLIRHHYAEAFAEIDRVLRALARSNCTLVKELSVYANVSARVSQLASDCREGPRWDWRNVPRPHSSAHPKEALCISCPPHFTYVWWRQSLTCTGPSKERLVQVGI